MPRPTGEGEASDYASVDRRGSGALSALHRPRVHRGDDRALAAVAEGAAGAAGQRPINNVVDITNYVMLLTAQPLHAFDLDRVPGRRADRPHRADGEKMTTLDGVERSFDSESVLVCDRDGPSGHRRDHGRSGLGGVQLDHARPARGRDLERGQHPAHLAPARPAIRGVEPVREAAPSRARRSAPSGSPRS